MRKEFSIMDNEYTYYTGQEPSNQNMNGNMNGNRNQNMNGSGGPRKPKKGMPKWVKVGCAALAFATLYIRKRLAVTAQKQN